MSEEEYELTPIGRVQVDPDGFALAIAPAFRAAMSGLEAFGHIHVLWWSHYLDKPEHRNVMEAEQPYKDAPARLGIFATRSPLRPNPICISTVSVLQVDTDQGLIVIAWIDAEDGTPILDIKPYHPSSDRIRDIRMPAWCQGWPQWYEDSATFDWEAVFVNAQ